MPGFHPGYGGSIPSTCTNDPMSRGRRWLQSSEGEFDSHSDLRAQRVRRPLSTNCARWRFTLLARGGGLRASAPSQVRAKSLRLSSTGVLRAVTSVEVLEPSRVLRRPYRRQPSGRGIAKRGREREHRHRRRLGGDEESRFTRDDEGGLCSLERQVLEARLDGQPPSKRMGAGSSPAENAIVLVVQLERTQPCEG